MKLLCRVSARVVFPVLLLVVSQAVAADLVIEDGGELEISSAALDLDCQKVVVENGGVLTLADGHIENTGRIVVVPGGVFSRISGTVSLCYVVSPGIYQLLLLAE